MSNIQICLSFHRDPVMSYRELEDRYTDSSGLSHITPNGTPISLMANATATANTERQSRKPGFEHRNPAHLQVALPKKAQGAMGGYDPESGYMAPRSTSIKKDKKYFEDKDNFDNMTNENIYMAVDEENFM